MPELNSNASNFSNVDKNQAILNEYKLTNQNSVNDQNDKNKEADGLYKKRMNRSAAAFVVLILACVVICYLIGTDQIIIKNIYLKYGIFGVVSGIASLLFFMTLRIKIPFLLHGYHSIRI